MATIPKTIVTQLNDTWDKISYRIFGSEFYLPLWIRANQDYRLVLCFDYGVTLNVPQDIEPITQVKGMPAWVKITKTTIHG
jgi:hypothetical protein